MSFEEKFNEFIPELTEALTVPNSKDWAVKGFIDYHKNIYSISTDTKVVSKIIELMIFPKLLEFAQRNGYTLELAPHQNYYPDITFVATDGKKYAVDLKSSYRITSTNINGMTLGAFTGYFRNRDSSKNTLYPYSEYEKHYVFGIIYSRTDISKIEEYLDSLNINMTGVLKKLFISYINKSTDEKWKEIIDKKDSIDKYRDVIEAFFVDETKVYSLDNFTKIESVVQDFDFFIQEKWKIATDKAGSGNTKNIGSEKDIDKLKLGEGLFYREFGDEGKKVFDNYWMNYENKDMSRKAGRDEPQFKNIETYKAWVSSLQE